MKILATICARGGSKGIKNKNIRLLLGKPLIGYTIEYLKKWGNAERIVCSTDSQEIASVARTFGAEIPAIRPPNLATDNAPKIPVLQHLLMLCEKQNKTTYDIIIDLDPTAPLRKLIFIKEAFQKFIESNANNLYSVCIARKNPYFNMVELDHNGYASLCKKSNIIRRQDAKLVYELNASIYIYRRDFLLRATTIHSDKTITYEMPDIASIDIDREIDLLFVEYLLKNEVFTFD